MGKIILLGYMGSGKSVTAALLSQKQQLEWLDLDHIIEKKANASISELFEKRGEIFFRKLEHEVFGELMTSEQSFVLSLGGGTPCYANNHELLKGENVVSFYLKASIETLYGRLSKEKEHRPLIANMQEDQMKEFIAISLFERSYFYHQASHTIAIDGKTTEAIVSEIENLLV